MRGPNKQILNRNYVTSRGWKGRASGSQSYTGFGAPARHYVFCPNDASTKVTNPNNTNSDHTIDIYTYPDHNRLSQK